MAKTAAQLVAEAKASIENLTAAQAAQEIAGGDVLVVDIREPEERRVNGVIAGAVSAPRGMLEFYADPASPYHKDGFDPARRVILHCASGGRSALAVKSLQELGYSNIAHLDTGFNGWKEQGQPIEDGQ
ncbi:MAG: rhodanese-like domain-containing protein [Thermomicrobiales bacterium]